MVVRRTAKETFPCQDSRSQHEHKFAQVPGPIRTIEMVKIMLKWAACVGHTTKIKDSRKWSLISRGNGWSSGVFVWSLCLCCRLGLCDHCYSGGQCGWHHAEDSKPLHIGKEGWQRNCETSRGLNCLLKANMYVFNWVTFLKKSSAIPGYCKDCKCCKFTSGHAHCCHASWWPPWPLTRLQQGLFDVPLPWIEIAFQIRRWNQIQKTHDKSWIKAVKTLFSALEFPKTLFLFFSFCISSSTSVVLSCSLSCWPKVQNWPCQQGCDAKD